MEDSGAAQAVTGHRMPYAWVLLVLIFVLLISIAVSGAYSPDRNGAKDYTSLELGLKMALAAEGLKGVPSLSVAAGEEGLSATAKKEIGEFLDTLEKEPIRDEEGARLDSVMAAAVGRKPTRLAIHILHSGKDPKDMDYLSLGLGVYPASPVVSAKSDGIVERFAAAQFKAHAGDKHAFESVVSYQTAVGAGAMVFVFGAGGMIGLAVLLTHFGTLNSASWIRNRFPIGNVTGGEADRLALRTVAMMVVFIVVGEVASLLMKGRGINPIYQQLISYGLVTAAAILSLKVRLEGKRDPWGVVVGEKGNIPQLVAIGFGAFLAEIPLLGVVLGLSIAVSRFFPTPTHPLVNELAGAAGNPLALVASFLMASVMAPLFEETTFRGLCGPAIAGALNKPWAGMVISSFLFASLHPQGPGAWLPLAGFGLVSAYTSYRSGSLIPCFVLHGLHNGALVALNIMLNMK